MWRKNTQNACVHCIHVLCKSENVWNRNGKWRIRAEGSEIECSRHTFKAAPHITQQSGFKLYYIEAFFQEPFGTISTNDDSRHSIDFHSWCRCQIVQMSSQNGLEISFSLFFSHTLSFFDIILMVDDSNLSPVSLCFSHRRCDKWRLTPHSEALSTNFQLFCKWIDTLRSNGLLLLSHDSIGNRLRVLSLTMYKSHSHRGWERKSESEKEIIWEREGERLCVCVCMCEGERCHFVCHTNGYYVTENLAARNVYINGFPSIYTLVLSFSLPFCLALYALPMSTHHRE